ncbi:MAG: hypothetical protein VX444_08105 [Pseudomonadota bacterium]|nr:hypothetical protein [Pseudomonadota bacterium]
MKRILKAATAVSTAAAIFATPAFADTTSDVQSILNKKLYVDGQGSFVRVKKNMRIDGKVGNGRVKGAWELRDGLFCRTVQVDGYDANTACQKVEISGETITFTTISGPKRPPRTYFLVKPK